MDDPTGIVDAGLRIIIIFGLLGAIALSLFVNILLGKKLYKEYTGIVFDIVIKSFYKAEKPIGTMCTGVILVAKSISEVGNDLSVGMVGHTFRELFESLGVTVHQIIGNESYTDYKNKLVNTPAFLGTQKLDEILEGLESMVISMISM